jgi:hypothetical protein
LQRYVSEDAYEFGWYRERLFSPQGHYYMIFREKELFFISVYAGKEEKV